MKELCRASGVQPDDDFSDVVQDFQRPNRMITTEILLEIELVGFVDEFGLEGVDNSAQAVRGSNVSEFHEHLRVVPIDSIIELEGERPTRHAECHPATG